MADRQDQPGFLRQRDELVRPDQPAPGMFPSDQGFDRLDVTGCPDLRLVMEQELVVIDRLTQFLLQGPTFLTLGFHG